MRSIVFLTNIPTPYRLAFFNEFALECEKRHLRLHVLYCARTEQGRHWAFDPDDFRHEHSFLPGAHVCVKGDTFHLNPSAFRKVRALRPDVLICSGAWTMPSVWLGIAAARLSRSKILFWSEGHLDAVRNIRGGIAQARRFVFRLFDGFAVPNHRSGQWALEQAGPGPVLLSLPNTVDESFYLSAAAIQSAEARRELGVASDERVLIQVSQLEPKKGVIELAEAYSDLVANRSEPTRLVFLGEGSLRDRLETMSGPAGANGHIQMTGHLGKVELRLWLAAANLFVLNTFRDPNPLSPIEASFAGLPLLISQRAGNHDELLVAGAGISIEDPSNPRDAIAHALSLSIEDLKVMGAVAKSNALDRFSRGSVIESFINELEVVVTGAE